MEETEFDVAISGSGGAGLLAAAVAATAGLSVAVLERSGRLGGTTAVSGGMLWVPNSSVMKKAGLTDTPEAALIYLERIVEGTVPSDRLQHYIDSSSAMVDWLLEQTGARFTPIDRPDYHSDWPGAVDVGRCLDLQPFSTAADPTLLERVRRGPQFPPLTYDERHRLRFSGTAESLIAQRVADGVLTVGAALVAALVSACDRLGVSFLTHARATSVLQSAGSVSGLVCEDGRTVRAKAIVLASGGFEWDPCSSAYLGDTPVVPVSPPFNTGDGLRMAVAAGAAVERMSQAWWVPAFSGVPEEYEGAPLTRHLVSERCLPGSIMVNRHGRRFVNEAINYNDVTRVLFNFDANLHQNQNLPAWLVFDERFRVNYPVGPASPHEPPPSWFISADSPSALADKIQVSKTALTETIERFSAHAKAGVDPDFGRGETSHDRYYGDPRQPGNPCLGALETKPYYAVKIIPGTLGTKGGPVTTLSGEILTPQGTVIPSLYACGNVSAGVFGPGYPGSGGTLGPALTAGYNVGRALARTL